MSVITNQFYPRPVHWRCSVADLRCCCFSHYCVSSCSSGSPSLLSSSCWNRACWRTWLSGTLKTWPRSICFLHCTVCTAVGNHTGSEISAFLLLSGCFMITVPRRHPHWKHFDFWGIDMFFQDFDLYRCMCNVFLITVAQKSLQGSLALMLMTSIWDVFLSWKQRKDSTRFDIIFLDEWIETCMSCIGILKGPLLQAWFMLGITLT